MSIIDALRALVEDRAVVWGFIGLVILNPVIIEVFHAPVGLRSRRARLMAG